MPGLSYQMLRTYTDGVWPAHRAPPNYVLAIQGNAADSDELQVAVNASMGAQPSAPLSDGERAALEAVRSSQGQPADETVEVLRHVTEDLARTPHRAAFSTSVSPRDCRPGRYRFR